jgi:2-polyprenyl-3-methyl-5-hydroxy-6-metoxy-1,4-benzoquinol methylase
MWLKKNNKVHWERAHINTDPIGQTWYQVKPDVSLAQIKSTGISKESKIMDVGGGISTLVDYLLEDGFKNVTVLDISPEALKYSKERLGDQADKVIWLEDDITNISLDCKYDLWHDRALFHFLTKKEDRKNYIASLKKSLKPSGHVIISTFSLSGPKKCCGLKVKRYSSELLQKELGTCFSLVESVIETHVSQTGYKQDFLYCRFTRR